MFRKSAELLRDLKGDLESDISKLESYMPSHAVGAPQAEITPQLRKGTLTRILANESAASTSLRVIVVR